MNGPFPKNEADSHDNLSCPDHTNFQIVSLIVLSVKMLMMIILVYKSHLIPYPHDQSTMTLSEMIH